MDVASIDIRPDSETNPIQLAGSSIVPVAILSSSPFDVLAVDVGTVYFGADPPDPARSDCTESHRRGHLGRDFDSDGVIDLLLHFDTSEPGIALGDETACSTGRTLDGRDLRGCDSIRVQPLSCGLGFEVALVVPLLGWLRARRRAHGAALPVRSVAALHARDPVGARARPLRGAHHPAGRGEIIPPPE